MKRKIVFLTFLLINIACFSDNVTFNNDNIAFIPRILTTYQSLTDFLHNENFYIVDSENLISSINYTAVGEKKCTFNNLPIKINRIIFRSNNDLVTAITISASLETKIETFINELTTCFDETSLSDVEYLYNKKVRLFYKINNNPSFLSYYIDYDTSFGIKDFNFTFNYRIN